MSHGPFVWHELMVPNTSSAPAFYQNVTGWDTQKWPGGDDYTLWVNGQAPVGGLMQLPTELASSGVPPHWLHYVGVSDVDATATQAQALGGNINVPPTDIPDVGRFAVIADPQGAVFAIYNSQNDQPPAGEPVGEFSWHELATSDQPAAFDFYSKLLGWKETSTMDMGGGMQYHMFGLDDSPAPIGGMYTITESAGMPPNWLGYVLVKNADDAVTAVTAGGGAVLSGPMDIPGGRVAIFADPQGAAFAVHQRTDG